VARHNFVGMLITCVALAGCAGTPAVSTQAGAGTDADPGEATVESRFISASGTARITGDAAAARDAADRLARQSLGDSLSAYTDEALSAFFAAHPEYPSPSFLVSRELIGTLSAEVCAAILRSAAPRQESVDGGKAVRVSYAVEKKSVDAAIERELPRCLEYVNPFGDATDEARVHLGEFLAERARESMKEAIRARPAADEAPPERRLPTWLETGRHKDYPDLTFMTAIGLDPDLEAAAEVGAVELARRAAARLRSAVRRAQADDAQTPLALNLRVLGEQATAFERGDLRGWRIAARWYDPVTETHYVYAVLDRMLAVPAYRRVVEEQFAHASELAASARNHRRAGNWSQSLKAYIEAIAAARAAVLAQARALALAHDTKAEVIHKLIPEPVLVRLTAELAGLLGDVAVDKQGGEGQWLGPDGAFEQPFTVRVTEAETGRPLADLPVRLRALSAAGTIAHAVTDAQGRAALLPAAGAAGSLRGEPLAAELDLEAIASSSPEAGLVGPRVEFRYLVRDRANTRFAVLVQNDGAETLDGALRQAIASMGLELVPMTEILEAMDPRSVSVEMEPAELARALKPLAERGGARRFLMAVVARARPQVAQTLGVEPGAVIIAHCPYTIRLVDARLPVGAGVPPALTGKGRAASTGDSADALNRALEDAAYRAGQQLCVQLRRLFGAPRPAREN